MAPARTIPPFPPSITPAHLSIIDFALLSQGDETEAQRLFDATQTSGFLYLNNHGVDSDFMFDLATEFFQMPLDAKKKYENGISLVGYRASGTSYVDAKGTADHTELYGLRKDDILGIGEGNGQGAAVEYPECVERRKAAVEQFIRACHHIATALLSILGVKLGLEAHILPDLHRIDRAGGNLARVIHNPPLLNGEEKAITLGEHSDFGSVTVLFNEVGGLQVRSADMTGWKYVKPQKGMAVVNLGDAVAKFSNGKLVSGLHRVVPPPGDQAHYSRYSCGYFARPNGHVLLKPLIGEVKEDEMPLTADEWIARRTALKHSANFKGKETYLASRGTEHIEVNKESPVG